MELSAATIKQLYDGDINIAELRRQAYQSTQTVDVIAAPIEYEEFFLRYLLPNRPCVLDTWSTDGWRSRTEWVLADGHPNVESMKDLFGGATCPVANCGEVKYDAHIKNDIKFAGFIDYLKELRHEKSDSDAACLYLKDWHFVRQFPNYGAYETAVFFQSDWLNEFFDEEPDQTDDYRFVYFGPQGSWTPFHADVMMSYSWSANVCGRKKWLLFPPGEEECMRNDRGQLAFDLNSPEMADRKRYSRYGDVTRRIEVIQEAGQTIFVPSGWHHQVFNLEDTISINHNWLNGCNVDLCWEYIKHRLLDVQSEISDCRQMDSWGAQCQLILKSITGIDYAGFFRFLRVIGNHRMEKLKSKASASNECKRCDCAQDIEQHQQIASKTAESHRNVDNYHHLLFDLMQIAKVISDMLAIPEFVDTEREKCLEGVAAVEFLHEIRLTVEEYFADTQCLK